VSLIGNGKSDVRNHFSTHRKSNLHLVSAESHPDAVHVPQEQVEIAKASAPDPNVTSDQQSAIGSPATAVPARADEQTMSESPNS
jgi:hypothetical protein